MTAREVHAALGAPPEQEAGRWLYPQRGLVLHLTDGVVTHWERKAPAQ